MKMMEPMGMMAPDGDDGDDEARLGMMELDGMMGGGNGA